MLLVVLYIDDVVFIYIKTGTSVLCTILMNMCHFGKIVHGKQFTI